MKIRKFFLLILISSFILILSGCNKSDEELEVEKGLSEIRFLENQCISIFEKYIDGDYVFENDQIEWSMLKEDYAMLKNSIDVILIDMASLQVPSKSIVELENQFIDLDNYIQSKELNPFIQTICEIYDLLANTILDSVSNEEWLKQEKRCKSDLLYIGYNIMTFRTEDVNKDLNTFQENFADLSKNQEYLENNAYKVNRVFMDIQELKAFIETENFESAKESLKELLEYF